jgi:hypothetical protein
VCPNRTNALGVRSSSSRQKGSVSSERRTGTNFSLLTIVVTTIFLLVWNRAGAPK